MDKKKDAAIARPRPFTRCYTTTTFRLLLLQVLYAVQCNGCNDDKTLEHKLEVGVDSKEGEAVGETGEDDDTDDRTANLSDSSVEGDSTHNTGGNGIKLVALSSSRTGVGLEGLQEATTTIEDTGHDEHTHGHLEHADTDTRKICRGAPPCA